jgi:hypothetical protein
MRFLVFVTPYKGKKGKCTDCNGRNNPLRPYHDTTLHIPNRRVQYSKVSWERIVGNTDISALDSSIPYCLKTGFSATSDDSFGVE